jgi:hypothetical protein
MMRKTLAKILTVALGASFLTFAGATTSPATASDYVTPLYLSVVGQFNDSASRNYHPGYVAGTIKASDTASNFTFIAGCTLVSGAGCGSGGGTLDYTWDFGDGQTATTTVNSVTHGYTNPGLNLVKVTANLVTGAATSQAAYFTGTGRIETAVSYKYADSNAVGTLVGTDGTVKAQTSGDEAIWTTTAAGLEGPCGVYVPGSNPLDGSTTTDPGRAEFCPEPPGRTTPQAPLSQISANGATASSCLTSPATCGLPAYVFADNNSGDPTQPCNTACQADLVRLGVMNANLSIPYDPTRCLDNLVATSNSAVTGTWQSGVEVQRGVEPGCESYRAYLLSLVKAIDDAQGTTTDGVNTATYNPNAAATRTNLMNDPSFEAGTAGFAKDYEQTPGGTVTLTQASSHNSGNHSLQIALSGAISGRKDVSSPHTYSVSPGTLYTIMGSRSMSRSAADTALSVDFYNSGGTLIGNTSYAYPQGDTRWSAASFQVVAPPLSSKASISFQMNAPQSGDTYWLDDVMLSQGAQESYINGTIASICPSGPEPDNAVKRARDLLGTSIRMCDTDTALTKFEAYELLAVAAKTTNVDSDSAKAFRDLINPTLQATADSTMTTTRSQIGGVLATGAPLVGSTQCADATTQSAGGNDPGVCFNGSDSLSRVDSARLLAHMVLGPANTGGAVVLDITVGKNPTPLGSPVSITATASVPAYYDAATSVNFSFPAGSTVSGTLTCPSGSVVVGTDRRASKTCLYTPTAVLGGTTVPISVTATSSQGTSTTAAVGVVVSNTAPSLLTAGYSTSSRAEKTSAYTIIVPWSDQERNPVTVGVRSCDPSKETCVTTGNTFPQTGKSRNLGSDTTPASFDNQANTETGLVSILSQTSRTINLTFTPDDSYANGDYNFVVQVCDTGGACSHRVYTDTRTPVNDPPVPTTLSTATTTTNSPVTFTLTGTDPQDTGRDGYTSTLDAYQVTAMPSGTLEVSDGSGGWNSVTQNQTLTRNLLRWTPQVGSTSTSLTFKVHDAGDPTPGTWSTATGTVILTNDLPDLGPTANLLVTPTNGGALATAVTADASGSTPSGAYAIASYTYDWGDGSATGPQSGSAASHRYSNVNTSTYTITLTVTDVNAMTDTATYTYTSKRNFIANPTFEGPLGSATNRWAPSGGSTLSIDTPGHDGSSQALMIIGDGSGTCQVSESPYSLNGNSTTGVHTLTLALKGLANGTGKVAQVTITEKDSSGTTVGAPNTSSVTLTSAWQNDTLTYNLSNASNSLAIAVSVNGVLSGGPCADIDDVSLVK